MQHQFKLFLISGAMLTTTACGSTKFTDSGAAVQSSSAAATLSSALSSSASDADCENGSAVHNPIPDIASPDSPMEITLSGTDIQNTNDGNLLYTFTLKNELAQSSSFRAQMGCGSGSGVIATSWSFGQDQMRDTTTGTYLFANNPVISLSANESRTYQVKVFGVRPLDMNYNPCWIVSHTRYQQDGAKCVGTVR